MKKLLIVSFVTFILLFSPKPIFASPGDISNFDTQIVVHKDGTMEVAESISYQLRPNEKHGIYRDIPLVSQVGDLYRVIQIEVNSVTRDDQPEKFTVSTLNNELHLKIGDPNTEISGSHTYLIKYSVQNGIGSNFSDHDEIYWNVTGNNWLGRIEKATLKLSNDFGATANGAKCFTGRLGSSQSNCTIPNEGSRVFFTNQVLNPNEGFSIVTSFPVGTFPKSSLQKNKPVGFESFLLNIYFVAGIIFALLFLNILLPLYLLRWYFLKKSNTKFGPPTVNFDFPIGQDGQRLTPLEAGIMDTAKIDKDDVIATIYDLAIRKYIRLENQKKDIKIIGIDIGDKDDYLIIKLKDYAEVTAFEKRLLDRLFRDGDSVSLETLSKDFYKTYENLETDAFEGLVQRGFYTKNPKFQIMLLRFSSLVALLTLSPILAITLFYLSRKLTGRTIIGDEADHQIDGLKLFLAGRAREYDWNTQNLQVVERMIPYALSLGFIAQFMKQFQATYPEYQPSWYSGYTPFYLGFNGLGESFNSNLTTSAPSSSSGMGGGFSGGGAGGGGGGGW